MRYVIDSAVWMSLYCGRLHLIVLQLGDRIFSVDYIVEVELKGSPSGDILKQNGLTIKELDGTWVGQAEAWRTGNPELSTGDVFSLALALQETACLATRDANLEKFADAKGATVCDVLTIISEMLDANLLTSMDMSRFRKGMSDQGRDYDIERFKQLAKRVK